MKVIMWFMIITELIIIDDDDTILTQKISSPKLNTPTNVLDESYEGTNQQQQEVLHRIGFGPKILDTIPDRFVDKIACDGALAGAKPKFTIKGDKEQFTQKERYNKGTVCVCDVEHIAQLHYYISSTPQMQKHNVGAWNSESDIKMEVDDDGTEQEGYGEEPAKMKEHIMFHNQVYALGTLMSRKLKNGTDLSLMEDTLFSIDRTFR